MCLQAALSAKRLRIEASLPVLGTQHFVCNMWMQVCAVHASLISQLEAAGGLEEWALYVALHLPDCPGPDGQGSVREQAMRELLLRHAPALAASADKQAFVLKRLHIPRPWLAAALAVWARYNHNAAGVLFWPFTLLIYVPEA